MMLVNDQIKSLLPAIPLNGFENRQTFAAAANTFYALKPFLARRAGKLICKPLHFVTARDQGDEISQGHPLRAARQRIFRVAPVEHQETHEKVGKIKATKFFRAKKSCTCREQAEPE